MIKHYLSVFAFLLPLGVMAQTDYPLHFDKDAPAVSTDRQLRAVNFTTSAGAHGVDIDDNKTYADLTYESHNDRPGDRVKVLY